MDQFIKTRVRTVVREEIEEYGEAPMTFSQKRSLYLVGSRFRDKLREIHCWDGTVFCRIDNGTDTGMILGIEHDGYTHS